MIAATVGKMNSEKIYCNGGGYTRYFKIGKPNSCPINFGMDTTLEASVQHHSLKAEHPGETEASKSQSDEKHGTLALRVSN